MCYPVLYTYTHMKVLQLSDSLDYDHADCDLLILIPPTPFSHRSVVCPLHLDPSPCPLVGLGVTHCTREIFSFMLTSC
jgi:hypothetical protein